MEANISINTSHLIDHISCNSPTTSLLILIGLTIVLLSLLIFIVCILTYFVYKLRQQTSHFLPTLTDDRDIIFAFSNKHAEMMDNQSNRPPSSGSLADPWNTRSDHCDCQAIHKESLNRRFTNLGVHFNTYPKVNEPNLSGKWTQRVFSQPGNLHFRQSQLSLTQNEVTMRRKIPKNRMVERLLMEANHQDCVNSTRPL